MPHAVCLFRPELDLRQCRSRGVHEAVLRVHICTRYLVMVGDHCACITIRVPVIMMERFTNGIQQGTINRSQRRIVYAVGCCSAALESAGRRPHGFTIATSELT